MFFSDLLISSLSFGDWARFLIFFSISGFLSAYLLHFWPKRAAIGLMLTVKFVLPPLQLYALMQSPRAQVIVGYILPLMEIFSLPSYTAIKIFKWIGGGALPPTWLQLILLPLDWVVWCPLIYLILSRYHARVVK